MTSGVPCRKLNEPGRCSIHPVPEQPAGHGQCRHADQRHGPELVQEQVEGRALQEYPAQDHHEITQGIEQGDSLHRGRHIGDRDGKAREDVFLGEVITLLPD